ncbi:MAG: hypothetical protein ACNI27_07195 [Desulfovibrio sp.]
MVGAYCDLEYYDGDPNFPRISNFRWHKNTAPACEQGAFIIQANPDTFLKIDAKNNLIEITPANRVSTIGGDKTETISGVWTIKAPLIKQEGNVQSSGPDGSTGLVSTNAHTTQEGSLTLLGHIQCTSITVAEDSEVQGNSYSSTRTGGGM